jgi:hypothetical protein
MALPRTLCTVWFAFWVIQRSRAHKIGLIVSIKGSTGDGPEDVWISIGEQAFCATHKPEVAI